MCQTWAATPLRVAVIIGSTRESRLGDTVARWFTDQARRRDDLEPTVIDLVDFEFPARYPDRATPQMTRFAAAIGVADAFVVVTPEYNRSFPASLKQAIDYAYDEWQAKPVGFVSYGWCSAGLYAVEQLRTVFTELHAVTMRDGVAVNLLDGGFDGSSDGCTDGRGCPADADRHEQAATTMLDQLVWWGRALRDARAAHPYVS